jgi:hypothetical protein
MQFTPKSEAEIAEEKAKFGPWPRGAYDFEVSTAEDAISKKGSEMIVLELLVFDEHGNHKKLKDWLVESLPVKLKHACAAVGLHAAYENGNVASFDFVGRTGRLMLGIQKQDGFPDRNNVTGYVPAAEAAARPAAPRPAAARPPPSSATSKSEGAHQPPPGGAGDDLDDSIPF